MLNIGYKMTCLALFFLFYYYRVAECSSFINGNETAIEHENDSIMGCEAGWYSFNRRCYKLEGSKNIEYRSWEDASNYCRDDGGSLVVIENQETQDFVRLIQQQLGKDIWIGLHDRQKESEYTWVDGSTFSYKNWKPGEPSGFKLENEDCTQMIFLSNNEDTGQWNDLDCGQNLPFICQKNQTQYTRVKAPLDPMLCSEENNSGFKFRNSCYHFVKEKRSWEDAEYYCKNEYTGHLVAIRSFFVDLFLDYILKSFRKDIWIGISIKKSFPQKWSNGFFVNYNGWKRGKIDFVERTCATRTGRRQWSIATCTNEFAFICEQTTDIPAVEVQTIKDSFCPSEPDDWTDLGGNKCYFFETYQTAAWYEADFKCELRGGDLVSIPSKEESDIISLFLVSSQRKLHIGLHRKLDNEKEFSWTDKSQIDWTNWDSDDPSSDLKKCVEISTLSMKWSDVDCETKNGYICSVAKIAPKLTAVTELTEVETFSPIQYPDSTPYGTILTTVLGSVLLAILLLGTLSVCYFKPWIRKEDKRIAKGP